MALDVLSIIQQFTDRRGLEKPTGLTASTDDTVRQLIALANEVMSDVMSRGVAYSAPRRAVTITSIVTPLQGDTSTLAPDFRYIIPDTVWDRTAKLRLDAISVQEFTAEVALGTASSRTRWQIWQGGFYLWPVPAVGSEISFEYHSNAALTASDGISWKRWITEDGDIFQLDEEVLLAGLNAKWRREKGLSFVAEQEHFEAQLKAYGAQDPLPRPIRMDDNAGSAGPGLVVPSGSWSL